VARRDVDVALDNAPAATDVAPVTTDCDPAFFAVDSPDTDRADIVVNADRAEQDTAAETDGGDHHTPEPPHGGDNGGSGGEGNEHGDEEDPEDNEGGEAREVEAEVARQDLAKRIAERDRAIDISARGDFDGFVDLSDVPESAKIVEAPSKLLGFEDDNRIRWSNVNPKNPGGSPSYSQRMLLRDREVALVNALVTQPHGISHEDLAFIERVHRESMSAYGDVNVRQAIPVHSAMKGLMSKTDGTIERTEDGYKLATGVKVVDNRRPADESYDAETVAEMKAAIREVMSDL
jgi:hypothetical protein